jgi:transcriptional coactivator HFI1/ADA1
MADFDINPAALSSRPSISVSTPVLSNKSITVSSLQKPKTSQLIPSRIDLEPIYTKLKACIDTEQWPTYKEATTQFLVGMTPHPSCNFTCSAQF